MSTVPLVNLFTPFNSVHRCHHQLQSSPALSRANTASGIAGVFVLMFSLRKNERKDTDSQTVSSFQKYLQSFCCCRTSRAVSNKTATKGNDMSFEAEKQKYLSMSAAEKRQIIKSEPTTVDQILTWPEYWSKNKANIGLLASEQPEKVDEQLANKISIWEGDITKLEIDAIVNAANSTLLGGGGVDGAIHRAAGGHLKQECATLGGCRVGEAKITGGYMLPAKHVIHTVGPQGEKPEKLTECYINSLTVAKQNGLRTIAFPCISTGIYGYPQRPAAKVALSSIKKFLVDNPDSIDRVICCLFLNTDKSIYEEMLQKYFAFE